MGGGREDRIEILAARIVTLAGRDVFNNVGRVFIPELEDEGYTYDEIVRAVARLRAEKYKVSVVGDVIKVEIE